MASDKSKVSENPVAAFKARHALRSQSLNNTPKGWRPGHWHYSRLVLLLSLLCREFSRQELAHYQYLELLDSLERCKARADVKSICIPSLDRFLEDIDEFRSDTSLRLLPDPGLLFDIYCSIEKLFDELDGLLEETRERGGLVIEDCPGRRISGIVKELPGAPNKFPKDLLRKMKIMIHIADICYSELATLRPTLPEEEILLLAELRYADYEYRSERSLARDHGGVWPEEGITISARRRTDVDLFFMDPEDMMIDIEHILSTDSAGIGCDPEECTLKDSDLCQ